jgi:hypothetical protein
MKIDLNGMQGPMLEGAISVYGLPGDELMLRVMADKRPMSLVRTLSIPKVRKGVPYINFSIPLLTKLRCAAADVTFSMSVFSVGGLLKSIELDQHLFSQLPKQQTVTSSRTTIRRLSELPTRLDELDLLLFEMLQTAAECATEHGELPLSGNAFCELLYRQGTATVVDDAVRAARLLSFLVRGMRDEAPCSPQTEGLVALFALSLDAVRECRRKESGLFNPERMAHIKSRFETLAPDMQDTRCRAWAQLMARFCGDQVGTPEAQIAERPQNVSIAVQMPVVGFDQTLAIWLGQLALKEHEQR